MRSICLFLILLLWVCLLSVNAQTVFNFRGQVIDQNDQKPIPFVNIVLNGYYYGTSSNLDGRFELKIREDQIKRNNFIIISCIGYKSKRIALAEPNIDAYQLISLIRTTNELDDVIIKGGRLKRKEENQAKTLVMDAIDRIPYNKAKRHFEAQTFYRHYCKEDTTYVRLIEAALSIYQDKANKSYYQIPENRLNFNLTQLRRSFDFTAFAKLEHPPISLNFLLSNDLMNYEFRNPLRKSFNTLEFEISDTTSYQHEPVVVVRFRTSVESDRRRSFQGDLFINLADKAFIRADIQEREAHRNGYDSVHAIVEKKIFYERIKNSYYPNRVISDVTAQHFQLNSEQTEGTRHESHVELMVNNITLKGNGDDFLIEEPEAEQLNNVPFDSTFWNSYTVLESTPLEDKIIADLSSRMSLDKQFIVYNQLKEGVDGLLKMTEFKRILSKRTAKYHYVIFWADWAVPNYYELIPSAAVKKLIRKEQLDISLISISVDHDQWQTAVDINGLKREALQHDLLSFELETTALRKLFGAELPAALILNDSGVVVDRKPFLLNDPNFTDYFENLKKETMSSFLNEDR